MLRATLQLLEFFLLVASFLIASSGAWANVSFEEQQTEVVLRMVGHQVLLDAGDSTSRVLPVEKAGKQYRVRFDTTFSFQPEKLVATIDRVLQEAEISFGYILAVEECVSGQVVYSYQKGGLQDPDIIPCQQRALARGCYDLLFTLEGKEASNPDHLSTEAELDAGASMALRMGFPLATLLLALLVGSLIMFRKKRSAPESPSHLLALGSFQFDKRKAELLQDQQRTELTGKEAALLLLLAESCNTTLEREVILRSVWGDEGNYVGRTLDVFISKLRKKLQADPRVQIVNVRGVGYKLVVEGGD